MVKKAECESCNNVITGSTSQKMWRAAYKHARKCPGVHKNKSIRFRKIVGWGNVTLKTLET